MGTIQISGRFVGDAYMRPVAFARYIALPGWLQRAVNDRPYDPNRNITVTVGSRAGHAPPLPRKDFCLRLRAQTPPNLLFLIYSFLFAKAQPNFIRTKEK